MDRPDYRLNSLPDDVALKIASFLEVQDLSSLGCCSRIWREVCRSDCLWEQLYRERWPRFYEAVLKDKSPNFFLAACKGPNFKGWRACYIEQHEAMAVDTAYVAEIVERCLLPASQSLEIRDFMQTMGWLGLKHFGFKDVQIFFFKSKLDVLLNLVGLHYCRRLLQVPASHVVEALQSSKISDRQVRFNWREIVRLANGFCGPDESHSRCISLEDLAITEDEKMLGMFDMIKEPLVRSTRFKYPLLFSDVVKTHNDWDR
ncbi:hypothetical protein DITRI_Ditri15bG0116700 [Diplodiscus trichospermus]